MFCPNSLKPSTGRATSQCQSYTQIKGQDYVRKSIRRKIFAKSDMRIQRPQMRFIDGVMEEMQKVGVTEEDAWDRVRWRQMMS